MTLRHKCTNCTLCNVIFMVWHAGWVSVANQQMSLYSLWCRLDYQPLFGKMSPHSSPGEDQDRTRETAKIEPIYGASNRKSNNESGNKRKQQQQKKWQLHYSGWHNLNIFHSNTVVTVAKGAHGSAFLRRFRFIVSSNMIVPVDVPSIR